MFVFLIAQMLFRYNRNRNTYLFWFLEKTNRPYSRYMPPISYEICRKEKFGVKINRNVVEPNEYLKLCNQYKNNLLHEVLGFVCLKTPILRNDSDSTDLSHNCSKAFCVWMSPLMWLKVVGSKLHFQSLEPKV